MTKVHSDIIQFRGSHYDFGRMQGQLLKDSPLLAKRKSQRTSQWRHFLFEEKEVREALSHFAPEIWDEIIGLSDELEIPLEEAIGEFGGYYYEYGRSGCSIFTDADYMVRNYDSAPQSYEGRLLLYQPSDGGYASLGPSIQVTGRMDGINEKGFSIGYNFINRKKSGDGFLCNMIARIALEKCANVDEGIALLEEIPHRRSFTYVLFDAQGKSVVVEASPRKVVFREAHICTNHFDQLTDENRYRMDDSLRRKQEIEKQQQNITDPYQAYQMMSNQENGVFSNKYGAWAGTLHTSVYFPKEKKVWFAHGSNRLPLILDFGKWLEGEKLHLVRIKGELDSTRPFMNV